MVEIHQNQLKFIIISWKNSWNSPSTQTICAVSMRILKIHYQPWLGNSFFHVSQLYLVWWVSLLTNGIQWPWGHQDPKFITSNCNRSPCSEFHLHMKLSSEWTLLEAKTHDFRRTSRLPTSFLSSEGCRSRRWTRRICAPQELGKKWMMPSFGTIRMLRWGWRWCDGIDTPASFPPRQAIFCQNSNRQVREACAALINKWKART